MSDVVIMPVYNEAATVGLVLDQVRRHFSGEVIVIDDGSVDSTAQVLAARDDIAIVRLDRNCGYGCALRIGFDVAADLRFDRLVTMDCDGQHEPAHISQFLAEIDEGHDIVSGSRYLSGVAAQGEAPPDRQRINRHVTDLINSATGWSLTDSFCGFKAYRLSSLQRLSLSERGYAMPLELWAKAWRAGLKVRELAVERIYCDRDRSFGSDLDDPERRLAYYLSVWERALAEG